MKILTDSPDFANYFLAENLNLKKTDNRTHYSVFFNQDNCFQSEINIKENNYFKTLILNKESYTSQFDILSHNDEISENIICFSDSGNDFHGFKNRKWETLSGNFHLSLMIQPDVHFEHIYQAFIILAANSVLKTIKNLTNLKPAIKWVNDIMIDDSKIAGIITKTKTQNNRISEAIVGIGININQSPALIPDKFIKKAANINSFGYELTSGFVFREFLKNFELFYKMIESSDYDSLFSYYSDNSMITGKYAEIYRDDDNSELICKGTIEKINKDLTLSLKGIKSPVSSGRISMDNFFRNK